ncbi:LVIVD repeat-containing protein [Saccharopolyspora sp. CA-218241]|uniref:LVIVD repeat-containing protein n=1 Tax=Saccharopolyspora sp. CA-218241 TaxID=3240027 RepID=UPI003D98B4B0
MNPSSKSRRAAGVLIGIAPLVLGMALATPSAATPPSDGPEVAANQPVSAQASASRDVISSDNIEQVAHLPKQAPFDTVDAVGTDIAFQGDHAFVGNYDGFVVYDIKHPKKPRIVSQVLCPGGQGDVSISGDLLFVSTDYPRSNDTCTSEATDSADPNGWEGMKVFDVSDPAKPRYVSSIPTACGSHTHTLVPDKAGESVYLYISSYGPSEKFPKCQPPHDKISIVEVPLADPANPVLVDAPVLFPDGGNPGTPTVSQTSGCHDITVFPEKDLAAGACMGDGVLFDISDRTAPRVINQVRDDENFAFWHSATFNNDGSKVVFTDELGGGAAATCNAETGPQRGANGVYDIVGSGADAKLEFRSYYKIPRHQADTENCVAHNGSLIPVEGRDIMVQAWYQGGVSVWDFTDSDNPHEIGFFDRTTFDEGSLQLAGSWSAYYYNGYIYSSGIQEGLDVLDIRDHRTNPAKKVRFEEFNPQTQPVYGRR